MAKKTEDIRERFIQVFDSLRESDAFKSQTDAAQSLDISPQTLTEILKRRMNPSLDVLQKFFKKFYVNPSYIFMGQAPTFINDKLPVLKAHLTNEPEVNYGREIPMVGIEALAGVGNTAFKIEEKDIKAMYVIPDFTNVDFMMRMKGSSMYPKYNSGDVIACRILKEDFIYPMGESLCHRYKGAGYSGEAFEAGGIES
jgi:DNA-binding XRE family transcriptional regulator